MKADLAGDVGQKDKDCQNTPVPVEHGKAGEVEKALKALNAITVRETEVLRRLAEGQTTKSIAEQLYISTRTVEAHRWQLMRKLHIRSIAALTKYAIRQGLTSLD